MNKFKIQQLDENSLKVTIEPDASVSSVQDLIQTLESKGIVEDLTKSTTNERFFYYNRKSAVDQIIETLQKMADDVKARREGPGVTTTVNWKELTRQHKKQKTPNVSDKPRPNKIITAPPPAEEKQDENLPDLWANRLKIKGSSWLKRSENVNKSNYGPKGTGQYSVADNAKRKAGNTGEEAGTGPNKNVKAFSSKPGQLSAKQSADLEAKKIKRLNRKQPVKTFSPEEIAAINAERAKKLAASVNPDASHNELLVKQESDAANRLTKLMMEKSMLKALQPSNHDFEVAGERMGIGVSTEDVNKSENNWNGAINDWLKEATKPLSSRFSSEEEELEYWNSIRINSDDSGYSDN